MTENVIFNICSQRRKRQLFNAPVRIELENPPYIPYQGNYTIEQINMRRKAEILQYAPNKQSSQTNSATKTQKYSLIVNAPPRMNNNKFVSGNPCPSDNLIPVPTSSSDVPGPIRYLIYDKDVTLYNYVNPILTRAYSESSKIDENTKKFEYNFSDNISISEVQPNVTPEDTVLTMYFNIPSTSVDIDLVIPIGISFNGEAIKDIFDSDLNKELSISILDMNIILYYNNDTIITRSLGNIELKFKVTDYGKVNIFKYITTITETLPFAVTTKSVYDIKITYSKTISMYTLSSPNVKLIANMSNQSNIISNNIIITRISPSPNTYKPTFVSYT